MKKENTAEEEEQPMRNVAAKTKRKHDILERHKDEQKTIMARAVGAKKQKKPKAKLFTLDQPKHKPNFERQLRPPGLQQVCSRTIEKDVLGLFTTESTSSQNARRNVTKALNNRLRVVE